MDYKQQLIDSTTQSIKILEKLIKQVDEEMQGQKDERKALISQRRVLQKQLAFLLEDEKSEEEPTAEPDDAGMADAQCADDDQAKVFPPLADS